VIIELGLWWARPLELEEKSRLVKGERVEKDDWSKLHINYLELLALVVNTYVLCIQQRVRPRLAGEGALFWADSKSVVGWFAHAGGGSNPRHGVALRMLGAIEVAGRWSFNAEHIPGVENTCADCTSRADHDKIQGELEKLRPDVEWKEVKLPKEVLRWIREMLDESVPSARWEKVRMERIAVLGGGE
jgi:hypothetical protein